ncbi:sugar phosphate isomerase/epimerase family protein [Mycolicibacterium tokaiense]|uniref:Xylose isomerase-like TIM barrel n=1 Tax=Mycolicibacterium tokaiense TaxID=39695 RepID=A0A378TIH3_9MYCO|nr:sugar phosphate isomerase/epimerase [Mycolicibacterium tokaiense]BBY85541.1 xylose isomerase [Mycolicibacterium tokaiense]STZ59947.1 Xylose isomerase-like TIM barrel [Mycolicibacterium tokaiense]
MSAPPVAVQLWSVRDRLASDFDGTVRALAEIGFSGVETAFGVEAELDEDEIRHAATVFAASGLQVCSAHVELPLGDDRDAVLRQAEILDTRRIIWHGWPEDVRYGSRAGIEELIDVYGRANDVARVEGLEFGIHNHWWELRAVDGVLPLEILHSALDSSVFFELDVYWSTVAGVDPAALIARLGSRVQLIHVKDGAAQDVDAPMVALGQGSVDLEPTLAAIEHAAWWIVEFDAYDGDILDALTASLRYLDARPGSA